MNEMWEYSKKVGVGIFMIFLVAVIIGTIVSGNVISDPIGSLVGGIIGCLIVGGVSILLVYFAGEIGEFVISRKYLLK